MKDPTNNIPYVQRADHKNLIPVVQLDPTKLEASPQHKSSKKRHHSRQVSCEGTPRTDSEGEVDTKYATRKNSDLSSSQASKKKKDN
jgi:hypothetical protein